MMTAMRLTGELEALQAQRSVPYHIAKIYAAGGNKEKCFAWLEKAYEDGNPDHRPSRYSMACEETRDFPT